MEEHTNVQKYVVVVTNGSGTVWIVGTDTQRGFTEAGAAKAVARIKDVIPHGWDAWEQEMAPISDALASRRR
jgi:hypothetical protein